MRVLLREDIVGKRVVRTLIGPPDTRGEITRSELLLELSNGYVIGDHFEVDGKYQFVDRKGDHDLLSVTEKKIELVNAKSIMAVLRSDYFPMYLLWMSSNVAITNMYFAGFDAYGPAVYAPGDRFSLDECVDIWTKEQILCSWPRPIGRLRMLAEIEAEIAAENKESGD